MTIGRLLAATPGAVRKGILSSSLSSLSLLGRRFIGAEVSSHESCGRSSVTRLFGHTHRPRKAHAENERINGSNGRKQAACSTRFFPVHHPDGRCTETSIKGDQR